MMLRYAGSISQEGSLMRWAICTFKRFTGLSQVIKKRDLQQAHVCEPGRTSEEEIGTKWKERGKDGEQEERIEEMGPEDESGKNLQWIFEAMIKLLNNMIFCCALSCAQ